MTAQFSSRRRDEFRDLFNCFRINARFFCGEFESVVCVELFQDAFKLFEAVMSDKLQFVAHGIVGARLFDKLKFVGLFFAPQARNSIIAWLAVYRYFAATRLFV